MPFFSRWPRISRACCTGGRLRGGAVASSAAIHLHRSDRIGVHYTFEVTDPSGSRVDEVSPTTKNGGRVVVVPLKPLPPALGTIDVHRLKKGRRQRLAGDVAGAGTTLSMGEHATICEAFKPGGANEHHH